MRLSPRSPSPWLIHDWTYSDLETKALEHHKDNDIYTLEGPWETVVGIVRGVRILMRTIEA